VGWALLANCVDAVVAADVSALSGGYYGRGQGQILLGGIVCDGREAKLVNCSLDVAICY